MRRRRGSLLGALCAVLVLGTAACSGDPQPAAAPSRVTQQSTAAPSVPATGGAPTTTPPTTPATAAPPGSTAGDSTSPPRTTSAPPKAAGYFSTQPVGAWSSLPSGARCAQSITRSTWEPRPENAAANRTVPDPQAVHASLAARPRGSTYDAHWDGWLLPRVDGQFTGTTDEIIQWAACKWGISDNLLRAQAVRESTWYQGLHFTDGQCYWDRGCGDAFSAPTKDSATYCAGLARFGHDYQHDRSGQDAGAAPYATGLGMCPKTFSIIGVMSWDDPAWQAPAPAYPGDQNGTFPFSRDSTAFALDYEASYLRGCYEGWIPWLGPAGDMPGCVGAWFAGDWHSTAGDEYAARVQDELSHHTWLTADFADGRGNQYQCNPALGCPK
jgi:hypothetical protein